MSKKGKTEQEQQVQVATPVKKTKRVHNRGNCKVELLIGGKIVVIPSKKTVEVPEEFEIPVGIGLYVK